MCIVSMIHDEFNKRHVDKVIWPQYRPDEAFINPHISRKEFEKLKEEVKAMKKLIEAAEIFDKETNQKDCKTQEKLKLLEKIKELLDD